MTPTISARDVIADKASIIGSVPRSRPSFVCQQCLGPVLGYTQCYGCMKLFGQAPEALAQSVIPMSTVTNPGLWYSALVNYKNGSNKDHTLVAAVIAAYLTAHEARIEEYPGGGITQVVVVPSTRGRGFDGHPLVAAVRRSSRFRDRLVNALVPVPGATISRQEYKPALFEVDTAIIRGGRIALIEDLWVSGATALSSAGALLAAGALSVAVLPVAREFRTDTGFCPPEYTRETVAPYDIDRWPR